MSRFRRGPLLPVQVGSDLLTNSLGTVSSLFTTDRARPGCGCISANDFQRTSSLRLCFCLLAEIVEWPDISLLAVSTLGRGMPDDGLFSKGTWALLGVAPLRVPGVLDML